MLNINFLDNIDYIAIKEENKRGLDYIKYLAEKGMASIKIANVGTMYPGTEKLKEKGYIFYTRHTKWSHDTENKRDFFNRLCFNGYKYGDIILANFREEKWLKLIKPKYYADLTTRLTPKTCWDEVGEYYNYVIESFHSTRLGGYITKYTPIENIKDKYTILSKFSKLTGVIENGKIVEIYPLKDIKFYEEIE